MTSAPRLPPGQGFVEVADRCWVARYPFLDVNVGVVAGERGLLVVDTNASEAHGRTVLEDVRGLAAGEVVAVVNTHDHFDHCFGNAVFAEEYDGVRLLCHEDAALALAGTEPEAVGAPDTRVVVPENTFSSAAVVDLGDRVVEVVHPGRGHTAGDAVVLVPDADLLFAGDLVEESAARSGVPGFGPDCFPLAWPGTLDVTLSLLTPTSVVVPGHGSPVRREYVDDQRSSVGIVAETVRRLAGEGVPVSEALAAADWPYPREELAVAVVRGYAELPRGARSLPML